MSAESSDLTVEELKERLRHFKKYRMPQVVPVTYSMCFESNAETDNNPVSMSDDMQTDDSNTMDLQNFGSYSCSDDFMNTQTENYQTPDPYTTDTNISYDLSPRLYQEDFNNINLYNPRPPFGNYFNQVGMSFNNQQMYQQGFGNFNPNQSLEPNPWEYLQSQNVQPAANYVYNPGYPASYSYVYPQKYYSFQNQNQYPNQNFTQYPNQNLNQYPSPNQSQYPNQTQNYSDHQGWQIVPPQDNAITTQGLNDEYGQAATNMPLATSQQSNCTDDTSTQTENANNNATDPKNGSNDDPKPGPSDSNKTSNEESGSVSKTESRSQKRSRSDRSHSRERSRRRSSSRSRRNRGYSQRRSRSLSSARLRKTSPHDRYGFRDERQDRSNYQENRRDRDRDRNRDRDRDRGRDRDRREDGRKLDSSKPGSERQKLIAKWRLNNCSDQDEMNKRLEALFQMKPDEIMAEENRVWIRSAPANGYYERDAEVPGKMIGTNRLKTLCDTFRYELTERAGRIRESQTLPIPPPVKPRQSLCNHKNADGTYEHDSDVSEELDEEQQMNELIIELERKQKHPYRLHPELWYNEPGEMNDGPLCRCSAKSRRSGIRHGYYAGENVVYSCEPMSNNAGKLYHYRITISPPTNFLTRCPTIINYDDHEFIFEGFSLISHYKIEKLPVCKVIRFNIEYIILYIEEKCPENFCIEEVDLFYNYFFKEILELVDFDLYSPTNREGCPQFHFMPRFVRELPDNGRELLPMCEVLKFMLQSNQKLFEDNALDEIQKMSKNEWQDFADSVKGMIVTNPGMRPSSIRVDQIDRETDEWLKRYGQQDHDSRRRKRSPSRNRHNRSDNRRDRRHRSRNRGDRSNGKRGRRSPSRNRGHRSDESRDGRSPSRNRGHRSDESRGRRSPSRNHGHRSDNSRDRRSPSRNHGHRSDNSRDRRSPSRNHGHRSDGTRNNRSPSRNHGHRSDGTRDKRSPSRNRGHRSDGTRDKRSPSRNRDHTSDDSLDKTSPARSHGNRSDDSRRDRSPLTGRGNRSDDSRKSVEVIGGKSRRRRRGRRGRRGRHTEASSHNKSECLRGGTSSTQPSSRDKPTTSNNGRNTPISIHDQPGCSGEGRQISNNDSNRNIADNGESSQADSHAESANDKFYPEIVHFGIRPPQLSYAGNPEYQKAWRKYVKLRHLVANMSKPSDDDKRKLASKEANLHAMRAHSKMKRDVTITVSSKGFYLTGLMCDIVQHAMLIPILVCHLRFHRSLYVLEEAIKYKFKDKFLLQLALTHPSYRENFGTNSDHARNSLTNCGIRQPQYGDKRIHYMNTRKRGINTLISIMSRFGKKNETQSNIYHNERLEFLGDAVVEFITSNHLFHIFREVEEGGLATYRAALVQNQHLAILAQKLNLDNFMLYAHGSDLCHDLELKHAMANCFEALMGALFLDGGIDAPDKVLANVLYDDDEDCLDVWTNYPPHVLQEQEPEGDRKWIPHISFLQRLIQFEESTGIEFTHIRLLARAFTDRSMGFTNLTLGSNQRLEFLGDSVLQLISSEYLYKYFPEHHEGHLSLLRSSLVNNKTQSVVCDDLGMAAYARYATPKVELKVKDRADLLEAFLGALYVDSGLDVCRVFCEVCFFPRLQLFIMNQDWNDPKSKLQQCCLTLRTMDNTEPDIPVYKVIECKGPTNTRVYTVAVYFRNKRLAKATGHSIQQAEMNAAQKAMEDSASLFPQLDHQKRVIEKSMRNQRAPLRSYSSDNMEELRSRIDRERELELESE